MISPSGEQITVTAGDQRAVVVEVDGGLRSYSAGGRELVDGYTRRNELLWPGSSTDPVAKPVARWRKRSDRRSPVTFTNTPLAIQLASRQNRLSAAINETSKTNAIHTPVLLARASIKVLMPYCVVTEQPTMAKTGSRWRCARSAADANNAL